MASPQTENGYTRLANEVLEVIAQQKFNGTQFRILCVVWRYTYGFQRKEHELSVNFLVEATGITKRQIQKELTSLIEENVIKEVKAATFNTSRIIAFNKDYETWKCYTSTPKTQQVNDSYRGEQKDTSTGERLNTSTGERFGTQERKNKEIYKENSTTTILKFYETNFGIMSPYLQEDLFHWLDDFGGQADVLIYAMQIALERNKKSWGFVRSILRDWHDKNARTLDQCKALQNEFNSKQPRRGTAAKGMTEAEREAFLND